MDAPYRPAATDKKTGLKAGCYPRLTEYYLNNAFTRPSDVGATASGNSVKRM